MDSLIVPSSIQRLRSFLIERCGMKVKPWASTEETLAALHTTLVARHECGIFWASLRSLLETLARDLKVRQNAAPGTLVDNEVLDGERYVTLLDELRASLIRQGKESPPSSFRNLASALSFPALGLLLLLGGAASAGCDHQAMQGSSEKPDAAKTPDAAGTPEVAKTPDAVAPDSADAKQPADAVSTITLPDIAVRSDLNTPQDVERGGTDGAIVTLRAIMDACNISSQQQSAVLACLAQLRSSWTSGMATVLGAEDCQAVASDVQCFADSTYCYYSPPTYDFDPASTRICAPIPVYLGVRFV
jgi:hypothetical protein